MARRDLSRRAHDAAQLDNMAKITPADIAHAAAAWRDDAPPAWRNRLDATPTYDGESDPKEVRHDP